MHEFFLPNTVIRSKILLQDLQGEMNIFVVFRPDFENILTSFETPSTSMDHYLNDYIAHTHNPTYKSMGYELPLAEQLQFTNIELIAEHIVFDSSTDNTDEFPFINVRVSNVVKSPTLLSTNIDEGILHSFHDEMSACMTNVNLRTDNLELATMIRMII